MQDAERQRRSIYRIDMERQALIAEIERIQTYLGSRRGRHRTDPTRQRRKADHARLMNRLRQVNAELRRERRRMTSVMENGHPRPRTAEDYIAALYHMFGQAVDPATWEADEVALMRRTRDWLLNHGAAS